MTAQRIVFLTTNDFGFGGSEDLWAATALAFVGHGWQVGVSVRPWDPTPGPLAQLRDAGCTMMWHETPGTAGDFAEIADFDPAIVVVSQGYQLEGFEWLERLVAAEIPFVLVNECVHEAAWVAMDEPTIQKMIRLHRAAVEFLFVSEGNRRLYERMTGFDLPNAAVVRNPFKVAFDSEFFWPREQPLRLATVGRLECFHKGYDLLLVVLSNPRWHARALELHVYGDGPHRALLERLAARSGFPAILFHGQVSDISEVWHHNHVLIQPSRLEGLPLSIVEAMLCGRPVVATDVAGHSEVIEDGVNGFIASAAAPGPLDEALEKMWCAREGLGTMGRNAHAAIRRLVPRDPPQVFADHLVERARDAACRDATGRRWTPTVRLIPKTHRKSDDHHAHLYYAADGTFTEERKLAIDYPCGTWVTLRFSNLQGLVRFDPGARAGSFKLRRILISPAGDGCPSTDLSGGNLEGACAYGGTASGLSCDGSGIALASTGDDPILFIQPSLTAANWRFRLEIELLGE